MSVLVACSGGGSGGGGGNEPGTNTSDTTAPTLVSINPAAGSTIDKKQTVTMTFSESVKNVNNTNVSLQKAGASSSVALTIAGSGKVYTVKPNANLDAGASYTLTLKTGITDIAGNALAADISKSYTAYADKTPPQISSINPASGASIGNAANKRPTISVTFSENVSNVSTTNVVLKQGATAKGISISGSGSFYSITPVDELVGGAAYTLAFKSGITDTAGNPLAALTASYTGGDLVPPVISTISPANNGTLGSESDRRPAINVTFSETVNNVNSDNVVLSRGATRETATITGSGASYVIRPNVNLTQNASYTLVFNSGITDAAGNALTAVTKTYTSYRDTTAPTLTITPSHTSTGVARDTEITLTFSEEVTGVNTTNIKLSTSVTAGWPGLDISLEDKGNNTYRIKPANKLGSSTARIYYVVIADNSIKDISGNAYVPPATANTHKFTTSARTLPVAGADVEAWVGSSNTSLKAKQAISGSPVALHGFSNADCSLSNISACQNHSSQPFATSAKTYAASTLARTGYYRLKQGSDESKTTAISGQVFSGRSHHQTVVHNGKFWVMGGGYNIDYNGVVNKPTNDVWTSADGINWTNVLAEDLTSSTQFMARDSHSVLSYKGRLWVIGGRAISSRLNDVWSSADGKTWRRELNTDTSTTSTTQFSPRYGQQALVYKNKMYVFGGTGSRNLGDVWSSADGKTWTQASTNFPRVGYPKVVAHNNVLWLVGGYANNSIHKSTDDGVTWTQVLPSSLYAPHVLTGQYPARYGQQVAVLNNKIWVTGGHCKRMTNCGGQRLNGKLHYDTWVANINSNNSLSDFTKVSVNNGKSYHRRYFHTMTVRDNKLWIIGGAGEVRLNDVWNSTDGTEWTAPDTNASLTHYRHQIAYFKGKFWSFGGFNGTLTREFKMHSSINGIDWSEETLTGTTPIVGDGHQMLAFDSKLWIIGGRDANGAKSNKVYSSADGKAWTDVTTATQGAAGFSARYGHQVVVSGTSMYLTGGIDSRGYLRDVWKLDAGANQTWTKLNATYPNRAFHQAVGFDGKVWIIGGKGSMPGNRTGPLKDVLTTTSMGGMNTEADFDTRGRFDHQAAVLGNKLYVIAGRQADATSGYVNDVRSLTKGATSWVQETASAPFSKRIGHQLVSNGTHLYLFGGYNDLKAIPKDVWRSSDGVNWSKGTKATIETP